jgi:CheY-like chemotaxis protein
VAGLGGVRILVVEDEYFIAQDLEATLEAAGALVAGPVGDVQAALQLIEAEPIEAAVLDINLHGVVDFAVAAELTRRGIPFVFATGYEAATVPRTYEHVPIWRKPFNVEELIASLDELRREDG